MPRSRIGKKRIVHAMERRTAEAKFTGFLKPPRLRLSLIAKKSGQEICT
jgi:hypothetical protein